MAGAVPIEKKLPTPMPSTWGYPPLYSLEPSSVQSTYGGRLTTDLSRFTARRNAFTVDELSRYVLPNVNEYTFEFVAVVAFRILVGVNFKAEGWSLDEYMNRPNTECLAFA